MRDIMLITHFIGLTMGLGTSFAHMFLGMASAKMQPEEARKFRLNSLALSRMGHIGITLLIVSGIYLMTPFWYMLPSSPLLIAKLSLVVLLLVLITLITVAGGKAKKGDAEVHLKKMAPLGKFSLIIGLTTVILAVAVFH